jgi:lactate dehydrogenase-like 2-hydroxyacid dehydrogenase
LPNALLTPHTAGYSEDSMVDNRRLSVDTVLGFLQGRWPETMVNPAVKTDARSRARAFVRD